MSYPILGEMEFQEEDIFRVDNLDKLNIDSGRFSAPIPFTSNIVSFDSSPIQSGIVFISLLSATLRVPSALNYLTSLGNSVSLLLDKFRKTRLTRFSKPEGSLVMRLLSASSFVNFVRHLKS